MTAVVQLVGAAATVAFWTVRQALAGPGQLFTIMAFEVRESCLQTPG